MIVVTGDSISAELTHRIFIQASLDKMFDGDPDITELINKFDGMVNTGIGGHTVPMIADRFVRDCVDRGADIAIVNGGTNDLWGWSYSDTDFTDGWTRIHETCSHNGISLIVMSIVPATGFDNDMMNKRDRWNNLLRDISESRDCSVYADLDPYVGIERMGGTDNNLWDIRSEFDLDGVHYTRKGYIAIAAGILDTMLHSGKF